MASFYSSEGNHMLPNEYLLNQKLASYRSSELSNNSKLHVTQPPDSLSYPNFPSLPPHEPFEPESIENRDEMIFIPPTSVDQINRQLNFNPRYSDGDTVITDTNMFPKEEVSQYHGLSLSLGSQDLNQYANSSLCSLLNSENALKNVQYLSFDSPGKNMQFSDFTGTICNSKYLRAARELLDELVNVHRVSKLSVGSTGTDAKRDGLSGEVQESTNNGSRELSQSERHELQNKLTKLVSMLDEVDRRYKQYWNQMQALVSSLDTVAGPGASLPYTSLALRTISRQFRSLRDAIKKHILSTQKSLGEQDVNSHGVLSRLRYVDQQLRQQKSIQQFGVMRQPWRPQRGLPENAVSVLRAWLFEHFLHPYPKDSEKIVLARETGLTRSQVANWFINARVRLWKPMIEEMYKEEFGDAETELKSSPEHATTTQETSAFTGPADNHGLQSIESRPDLISNAEIDACRGLTYANDFFQGNEVNFGLTDHMQTKHDFVHVSGNSNFCDNKASQVTLALGLERISEKDSKPITENEYYYVGPVNDQNRFANAHLLSDFVA
ncbi:bel1-like homeodomain protein 6 [Phtheirospermum japonicum]|uniref:Bel1-like homeodomain protein 6 n=1 Tax=Phtheirospermum japonicum TaxID=374723 RepID=A0A830C7B1_9LAMI|nr:bel1-like homeodomain protein 6 [Phtheirospermum japonicum]